MSYLLDTCALIWLMGEPEKLSKDAREIIADTRNPLYTSDVSALEIQIKFSRGKLKIKESPKKIYDRLYDDFSLKSLPLKMESIFMLENLPDIHQDPFDRLLVAQAIQAGLSIISPDPMIQQYPLKVVW
ncbi:type II toxin-antitoxin system VapC family toxin [Kamptonema cortianum]|nr:type II toxin-antitoxin system VapC family toxin [Oscillatoria laete-virens]MDK3159958.1 type II toxin-antitoxin system VapC family toxin [Kamptonema cortianum]MDL5047201.1 type II toxin-antitoxin system VapC family toxin [Oscillatoria amoena NRMC-F 0135]MDL5055467.1 type II toxin-antitoxin system VapC family toxin [Oscillatoria laete-virens NRMC-F 0139]